MTKFVPHTEPDFDTTADGLSVAFRDRGGQHHALVTAQTNPLTGVIEISGVPVAPLVVVADGGSGATSGWIQTSASPERFALELTIATGGVAASLTLDGSNDGQTSAAQIATASLDTTGVQTITPPIKPLYPWIRWTVVSAGSGNVRIARGA